MYTSVNIFGVDVAGGSNEVYLAAINNNDTKKPIRIFTPNTEILLRCSMDEHFRGILRQGDILIPDGIGVLIASHILRTPFPAHITGIDFAYKLLEKASLNGKRVFLLGGSPSVAEKAAQKLQHDFPTLFICGTQNGFYEENESDRILQRIRESKPDFLFVCLGSPKQEEWIIQYAHTIPRLQLAIGLGGSLDVWSGTVRRAPRPLRLIGLEWLWRLVIQPHRWRILYRIPIFLWKILRQRKKEGNKQKILRQ